MANSATGNFDYGFPRTGCWPRQILLLDRFGAFGHNPGSELALSGHGNPLSFGEERVAVLCPSHLSHLFASLDFNPRSLHGFQPCP